MATPTITSISPSTLWTAGQLLTVVGTGFKVWTIPSTSTAVLPALPNTVKVTVDGVSCARVSVLSSTKLTFFAPSHNPGTATVLITNLDSAEAPIAGETSAPATITYARPDLTDVLDVTRTHEALIALLRQQIIENVITFVSVDYSETPFEATMVSKVPALILSGPTIIESDNVYAQNESIEVRTDDTNYNSYEQPDVSDLEYTLTCVTKNNRQLLNLQGLLKRFFRKTRNLVIDRDASDPSKGTVSYIIEKKIGDPLKATTLANKEDIRSFEVSFRILGVATEGLTSFLEENLTYRGGVADDITTTVSVKI